ncbi:MAG: Tat pathway signal sequence domain protein [Pseudomonadota bacterium]
MEDRAAMQAAPPFRSAVAGLLAGLFVVFAGSFPTLAASEGVGVELNKLEDQGSACQAFMVLENGTDLAFESLSLDLVLFDGAGIIARRLAVEMAPLRPGRTSVKVFGIEGIACADLGRILVNDVLSCQAGGAPRDDCLGLVQTSSRAPVELIN